MNASKNLRLLTWNLRHGGGQRVPEIVLSLLSHTPDVVALTEFHAARGGSVRGLLADAGLTHQLTSAIDPTKNAILIASRVPIAPAERDPDADIFPGGAGRFLDVTLPTLGMSLSAVHLPDDSRPTDKIASWQFLLSLARERRNFPWVVIGDMNSGRHGTDETGRSFRGTPLLGTFATLGMRDAWRHLHPDSKERSWAHPARGSTRIDACYLSELLHKCLKNSHFSHVEREAGVSDHSALIVDLDVTTLAQSGGVAPSIHAPAEGDSPGGGLFGTWKTTGSRGRN